MKELRNEHHHVTFLNVYIDRLHQWSPANHDRERRGFPGLPHIIIHVGIRLPRPRLPLMLLDVAIWHLD